MPTFAALPSLLKHHTTRMLKVGRPPIRTERRERARCPHCLTENVTKRRRCLMKNVTRLKRIAWPLPAVSFPRWRR